MFENDDFINAVRKLHHWQYENTGSFYDLLFLLFQKADKKNSNKLDKAFPNEYLAYLMWRANKGDQMIFFKLFLPELRDENFVFGDKK